MEVSNTKRQMQRYTSDIAHNGSAQPQLRHTDRGTMLATKMRSWGCALQRAIVLSAVVLLSFSAPAQVSAQRTSQVAPTSCNPPRANLQYRQWYADCEGMLQYLHRTQNPYGLPYSEYVRMLWQMYEVKYYPERHPSLVGSRCSPEGSGYMNQSGHAQICRGGRWTVGSY